MTLMLEYEVKRMFMRSRDVKVLAGGKDGEDDVRDREGFKVSRVMMEKMIPRSRMATFSELSYRDDSGDSR